MTIKDPVCGMTVSNPDPLLEVDHQGMKYFFCAAPCRDRFVEAPERYVRKCDSNGSTAHHRLEPKKAAGSDLFCRQHANAHSGTPSTLPLSPAAAIQDALDTVVHTCPMHPELRQDGTGDCPECGMALEPVASTAP